VRGLARASRIDDRCGCIVSAYLDVRRLRVDHRQIAVGERDQNVIVRQPVPPGSTVPDSAQRGSTGPTCTAPASSPRIGLSTSRVYKQYGWVLTHGRLLASLESALLTGHCAHASQSVWLCAVDCGPAPVCVAHWTQTALRTGRRHSRAIPSKKEAVIDTCQTPGGGGGGGVAHCRSTIPCPACFSEVLSLHSTCSSRKHHLVAPAERRPAAQQCVRPQAPSAKERA
jgi:hypothetical protein